jgi:hypothetical protein
MTTINKKIAFFLVASLSLTLVTGVLFAQATPEDPTTLVQEFTINIDKLGNANEVLTEKMTASQWGTFKASQIYNDPALSKRDLERGMSTYVIDDFKRDLDEMNRQVTLSLKVLSYAQYKGSGQWSMKIDSKNPQVTKLTDNAYMITGNAVMGNNLVQQIYKIYFPSSASAVTQTTDEFGKAIFTYSQGAGMMSYVRWNNITGLVLILVALFFVLKTQRSQNYNSVKA